MHACAGCDVGQRETLGVTIVRDLHRGCQPARRLSTDRPVMRCAHQFGGQALHHQIRSRALMLKLARDVGGNPGLGSVTHESGADGLAPLRTLDLDPEDAGFVLTEAIGVFFARRVKPQGSGGTVHGPPSGVFRVTPRQNQRNEGMLVRVMAKSGPGPVTILREEEWPDPAHALRVTEESWLRRRLHLG